MRFACEHLTKMFWHGRRRVTAVDDVSFRVDDGEFVCLVGASGCGKTTLLKLIAGLLTPSAGRVVFDDERPGDRLKRALVFQDHGLFPWMSVVDNVAFGLAMRGVNRAERRGRAAALLEQVGLRAFADSYPHTLSAGMRQRVSLARALLVEPHTLLMDEPFASLDALTKLALQQELLATSAVHRSAVLYVTHDIEEAVLLGDRVLVMTGGSTSGRIGEEIPIPLARPRDLLAGHQPEIRDLTWHIWLILEQEVRHRLALSS